MKKLILITFILIGLLLVGIGTFIYLPTIVQGLDFSDRDFRKVALKEFISRDQDSLWMETAEVMLPENPDGYVLIVPDRDYDRDWNSPGNQTRPGLRFARRLIERNMAVIRYSPPGSVNEEIDLVDPARSMQALLDVAEAFYTARQQAALPDAPITVLAVGEGCMISALALQDTLTLRILKPGRLILASCAYPDTLLNGWAGRIFYNMELSGVSQENMDTASLIWQKHRSSIERGEIPEIDEDAWEDRLEKLKEANLASDLLALEKTLSHLYRPSNRDWTRAAAQLEFEPILEGLRQARPDMEMIHVLGEYDEEIHPEDRKKQENMVRSSSIPNYRFLLLEKGDHGFVVRDEPPASPVENMMRRRDPFAEFSPGLLDLLAPQKD
ncbi:MAG: hypothetical protein KDK23_02790 [Leptospiraceae bacterium]|nr:hypothetical protein [Leptospiraceae bacterium]